MVQWTNFTIDIVIFNINYRGGMEFYKNLRKMSNFCLDFKLFYVFFTAKLKNTFKNVPKIFMISSDFK